MRPSGVTYSRATVEHILSNPTPTPTPNHTPTPTPTPDQEAAVLLTKALRVEVGDLGRSREI